MQRALIVLLLSAASLSWGSGGEPLSPKELKAAEKLYKMKCAKCHRMYEPNSYSDEDWSDWMRKMNRKSRLRPAQASLLDRYTATLRESR